ncbi:MAG: SulP family inorganic anion transporter [Synechocystis sp.]
MSASTPPLSIFRSLKQYVPAFEWLPRYQPSWLGPDILAGLTAWAVMVPEAMAYAGIAGVPPLMGLYTVPFPLFAYALLGTSRTMVVGPDSATALISSVTVATIASHGSADYYALTSAIALVVGIFFLVFGLFKMGWVANFIPTPVMKGFIQGLVWITIIGQVPKIFVITGGTGNFWQKLAAILEALPQSNLITMVMGLGSLGVLLLLKRYLPRWPSAFLVAILSIVIVSVLGLEDRGLDLIGSVSAGLPPLGLPQVSVQQLEGVTGGALAIVLLGYAESLGAANAAAEKTGEEIDPNQELISLGPANLLAGLSSGFLVVGSLSKTSVAIAAGAKTQITSVVMGILVIVTLMVLMPLFQNLPHATLAAIVIEAMLGLANLRYFRQLKRISPVEFYVATLAFLCVLFISVLHGIAVGVIVSMLLLIHRASHPGVAVLGQIPHTEMYRDIALHPEAKTLPGLLIFRFSSSLIFPNATYFRSALKHAIQVSPTPVQTVLIDAESLTLLDTTALDMLGKLHQELARKNITLSWSRLRDTVRQQMAIAKLEQAMGEENFHDRITDGVLAFLNKEKTP